MKRIITLVLLLSFSVLFAQKEVAKKVKSLENENVTFHHFSVLNVTQNQVDVKIDKVVSNTTLATLNKQTVNDIVANNYDNIELEIPYNGSIVLVKLYKVNIYAEGFHVDTNKQTNVSYQKGLNYRGIVNNDYNSVATFNLFKDELNGIVSSESLSNLVVAKLDKPNNTTDYIVYADANLKITNDAHCSVKESDVVQKKSVKNTNREINSTRCVTMYFEIDNNLYVDNGSDIAATTNWISSVFNNIQTLYANDGITVAIKSIYIWETQDPYDGIGTSSSEYLYAFNAQRPIFDGDVGQLVGEDDGGLGGVAVGINGLCTSDNFSYSDVNLSYSSVPTFSWTVEVMTHEFGHLLGSPHTHGCHWNGNDTAIDGCGQQVGYHEGTCANGPIPSSTVKGTIMSYCHLVSGVGINFNNGFGPQPAALILNSVNSGTCLSFDCVNTCINTVSSVNISSVTNSTATISWTDTGAASWQVSVYPLGGTPTTWTTATTNSYIANGLVPNTYYVAQVRPVCPAGLTSGGRTIMFVTAADFCNGITFSDSGGASANYSDMETVVRTIIPNLPSKLITISFSSFSFELDYDYLYIYNGNSTAAPDLTGGGLTGSTIPGTYTSSAADGSLTVKYTSDQYLNYSGFDATIACIENPLSVNNNSYIDFSYFPNPTNGKVAITSKTNIENIAVYNVTGQLLYDNKPNNTNTTVDIASFAQGTYFFKLMINNKEVNFKIQKM